MSTSSDASPPSVRRVLIASLVGTAVEFYDFYIYATAASLVFGPLFFPAESASAQLLAAYASFSIAFLARPLGASVFGHFGDRIGRKSTLVASLLVMGGSTMAIAFLPTYATAGWIAPALLCLMRFGQGFGLGGEWGGAALLAVENAPPGFRARYGMFPQLGAPVGFIAANGLFLLLGLLLSPEQFQSWGWRLPFLASALLVAIGLWVRLRLTETPAFARAMAEAPPPRVPLAELFREHLRSLVCGVFAVVCCYAIFYLATAFALGYGTTTLGHRRETFLGVQLGAIVFMAIGIILAGYLSDRYDARRVLIGGCILTIPTGCLLAPLMGAGSLALIGLFLSLALFVMGFVYGPLGAWLPGLFPARVRYTGASMSFNVGGILGGALAPMVAQALAERGGLWPVGLYLSVAAVVSLVALLAARTAHTQDGTGEASSARLLEQLLVWSYAAWAVWLILRGHLPYIRFPYQQNIDEGYLLAIGQRMLHGKMLPFVDGVAHSGPLFLFSGALIAWFDEFSWLPIRYAAALGFMCVAALVFACGHAGKRSMAGAIGATAIPLYTLLWCPPWDGIAYNAELPAVLCALGAVFCALRALDSDAREPSLPWLAATGALVACAGMSKQIGALNAVPITLYVLAAIWDRTEGDTRTRNRMLRWYFGAGTIPVLLLLGWYAIHGALYDLYYYVVVYNRDIYMRPFANVSRLDSYRDWIASKPTEMAIAFGAAAWGSAQLFAARRQTRSWAAAYRKAGLPVMVSQLALLGVVGAHASMRNFWHYDIVALPWFGLLAGLMADFPHGPAKTMREARATLAYQAVILSMLVLILEVSMGARDRNLAGWIASHDAFPNKQYVPPICDYVAKHSKPEDRIFVWGFRAEYYISCKRRPASRFVFTSFVAGYVPWEDTSTKEQEDKLAVPKTRALLIAELEREKPPLIIDTGNTSLHGRTMVRYDELAQYLQTHYRLAEVIQGEPVYVRTAP